MIELRRTEVYERWFQRLKDHRSKALINMRVLRLVQGNPGDVRPVGDGVLELRVHYGPGYRVYFAQMGDTLVILLAGGDKSTQERDIRAAKRLARELGLRRGGTDGEGRD